MVAQCGLALDRAQRYEGERVVAETLQRSVLPETLPSMEGARRRRLPARLDRGRRRRRLVRHLTLPDGRLGFVVGDVVGKGVQAASTMAQLRNGMRALTLDASSPAATIMKLNLLLENYIDVPFATLAYIALDPETHAVTLASAGPSPPLVVGPGRQTSFLESAGGLPLGVDVGTVYTDTTMVLEPGSVVVLYTDGLVERRGRSIDDGLADLARAAERAPRTPEAFVDALVRDLRAPTSGSATSRCSPSSWIPLCSHRSISRSRRTCSPSRTFAPSSSGGLPAPPCRTSTRATYCLPHGRPARTRSSTPRAGTGSARSGRVTLSGDQVRIRVADLRPLGRTERIEDSACRLIESLMASVDVERSATGTNVMERPLTRGPARGHAAHPAEH